jgi:hypothetical protein
MIKYNQILKLHVIENYIIMVNQYQMTWENDESRFIRCIESPTFTYRARPFFLKSQ